MAETVENAAILETFTPPFGTEFIELRPDRGYVLRFKRQTSYQECESIMQLWSGMVRQGLVGPIIILPMGVKLQAFEPVVAEMVSAKER
jgi:hypothetical protein